MERLKIRFENKVREKSIKKTFKDLEEGSVFTTKDRCYATDIFLKFIHSDCTKDYNAVNITVGELLFFEDSTNCTMRKCTLTVQGIINL